MYRIWYGTETRTSKRRLEEGSKETENRYRPHKKASEAKSPHAEENDSESSTDGEFDDVIKSLIDEGVVLPTANIKE